MSDLNHKTMLLGESKDGVQKACMSPVYNYVFNRETGFFARWGKTKEDDPEFAPFGPEILDLEVSEICHGIDGTPCKFCYKSNNGNGRNMSFETFKTIIDKFPKVRKIHVLTQIAFGIGDLHSNPDLFKMFEYSREIGIIPNLTINGWDLTDESARKLSNLCGAIAVSRYNPPDVCYDAVKKLTDLGMKQTNIHQLVSEETFDDCIQVILDAANDPRLAKLNAIVFLFLKPKGRGQGFTKISSMEKYKQIIDLAFQKNINVGFDSCSASSFLRTIKDRPDYKKLEMMVDACESTLFSSYINVEGRFFYCSFTEGEPGWKGIDVLKSDNFLKDVWYGEETKKFRENLLKSRCKETGCRKCPIFDLDLPKIKGCVCHEN